ncbi:CPBP family glutamic-type intramembrane protease [Phycicoccus sp.]|uniref:CPBP family glutamic-type intramembrane protease n=1 Tax=Phycicoccus sp. TaxID=1902410 RepID=UPI002BC65D62|nr:CPBP family glutamic-type intramembrane protease [Phycicoccus sp.]HMM96291.1 CPBP family glutamic-type intramembrane protease [Phycicoccus sp.]
MTALRPTHTPSPTPLPSPTEPVAEPVAEPVTGVVTATSRPRHLLVAAVAMFLLPWLVWGSAIAQAHDVIGWRLPQGIALWVLTPSVVVAALALGGRAGLADLVRRIVRRPGPVWVYPVAVLVPLLIGAATVGVSVALGRPLHLGETMSLGGCLVYLVYAVGLFLLTAEAGSTGLLLPRLQARLQPLAASVLLGLVWGLWHLPLLHVPGEKDAGLPFAAFLLLIVPTRVLMTAFVDATRGTVLVAAVFHAAFNATMTYTGVVGPDHALIWTAAVVTLVPAAVVAVVAEVRGVTGVTGRAARRAPAGAAPSR